MKPDISRWRDDGTYAFFDELATGGLAWEFARRNEPYQRLYRRLVKANAQTMPLPDEVERLWGLRFRGETWPFRPRTGRALVATGRSCCSDRRAITRVSRRLASARCASDLRRMAQ